LPPIASACAEVDISKLAVTCDFVGAGLIDMAHGKMCWKESEHASVSGTLEELENIYGDYCLRHKLNGEGLARQKNNQIFYYFGFERLISIAQCSEVNGGSKR